MDPGGRMCPTFRYGVVCDILETVNIDQALGIRKQLIDKWGKIKESTASNDKLLIKNIKNPRPMMKSFEGPAVVFPRIIAYMNNEFEVEVEISATVCVDPRHSKIWLKISYLDRDYALDDTDIDRFFDYAYDVSEDISNVVRKIYENIIIKSHISSSLKKIHTVKVETVNKNIANAVSAFESDSFKLEHVFEEKNTVDQLKWVINRTVCESHTILQKDSLNETVLDPKTFQWLMFYSSNGTKKRGLYTKNHDYIKEETSFVGIVNDFEGTALDSCDKASEMSKDLINHLAPLI